MPRRDYYGVLGVAKTASQDEIRKAYRKLARQFHPDVNKSADAQTKFTEVQTAYDVLSDEAKRRQYDQFGHAAEGGPSGARAGARQPHYTWTNVGGGGGAGPGPEMDFEDVGSMFEAFFGARSQGFGGAGGPGPRAAGRRPRATRSAPAPAQEVHSELRIGFMTAVNGGEERVRVNREGQARTIEVRIPKGVDEGAKLRIRNAGAGQGEAGPDLILTIRIEPHPLFRRGEGAEVGKGLDLYLDLPLTIAEATLGASVEVPTLAGAVELTIPPGTASGARLRLRGRGIEDSRGGKGDLYAIVKIVPPDGRRLTDTERDALGKMVAKSPSPRSGPLWPAGGS